MNPVQLAWKVLRADRRTQVATVLTAAGVAVATAIVLLLASLPQATETRSERSLWQMPQYQLSTGGGAKVSWSSSEDVVDGRLITRIDVAPLVDPATIALPPGIDRLPGPGQLLRSPELAALADERPAAELADRFGAEPVGLLGESALRFPEQLVVLVGHTPDTMPAGSMELSAFGVGEAEPDELLSLLAGVGVIVLLVPSLVLVASASRLIAARRERRLAALRLAGATPAQVTGMVAAETGIAAVLGAVLGVAVSPLLHRLATFVAWDGGTWLPGDFVLPPAVVVPIAVAVPVLVVGAAVAGLRRVVNAPLVAAGGQTRRPLSAWRLLLVPAALALFYWTVTGLGNGDGALLTMLLALGVLMWSPTVVGPWVTSWLGGLFVRTWRRPATLLAGRRLRDDPKAAYRASAGVVLAAFAGSMALTLMPSLEGEAGYYSAYRDEVLHLGTDEDRAGDIVAAADANLARYGLDERAGVVFDGELLDGEQFYSVVVAECATAKRLLPDTDRLACRDTPAIYAGVDLSRAVVPDQSTDTTVPLPADPPVVRLPADDWLIVVDPALWPADAPLVGVTVGVVAEDRTREAVRTALLAASGGEQVISTEMQLNRQDNQLADLRRVTAIGLVTASLLAGVSAAISTAGSVMDRRRTLGALMAAGTPVRTLVRALRAEAALPAMVATVGAGALGTAVGVALFGLVSQNPPVFSPWLAAPVALGALVAVLAASVCAPALRRVRAEPLAEE